MKISPVLSWMGQFFHIVKAFQLIRLLEDPAHQIFLKVCPTSCFESMNFFEPNLKIRILLHHSFLTERTESFHILYKVSQ